MIKLNNVFAFSLFSLLFVGSTLQGQNTPLPLQTVSSPAQTAPADFFVGSWNVKAMGLPDGDKEMVFKFEKKDGKLTGGIVDVATKKVNPFTSISQTGNKISASFLNPEPEMEISLYLEKKDDNKVSGSLMDMFNLEGTKAK